MEMAENETISIIKRRKHRNQKCARNVQCNTEVSKMTFRLILIIAY